MSDIRFALRTLAKSPAFTVVAVAMLALGIGASTACFSFLNAFFLRPPPFERPSELVSLHTVDERAPGLMALSYLNFVDYRAQNSAFTDLALHMFLGARLTEEGKNTDLYGQLVTGSFFDLLGVPAASGRVLHADDDREGAPPVAVVSQSFWKNRLGGNPAAIGRTVQLNGTLFTVVGVAPENFRGVGLLDAPEFWIPVSNYRLLLTGQGLDFFYSRRAVSTPVIGRLKPGVTLEQAGASLKPVAQALAKEYPVDNVGRSVRVVPIAQATLNPNTRSDMLRAGNLLMALSGLVLLIACANLANLLLARSGARQREIALRVALGASRGQVIRQLLVENFLLAAAGGLLGILSAHWLRDLLWTLRPRFYAQDFTVTMDAGVMAFAIGATLLTGLLFGLVPAWSATRVDLVAVIKRSTSDGSRVPLFSFRHLLVAAQVALSTVALVIAGLFVRSLQQASLVNPGWNQHGVALLSAALGQGDYGQPRSLDYYRRALERLRSVPGVVEANLSTRPFLTGVNPQRTIRPQGSPDEQLRTRGQLMSYASVLPGFLPFMGVSFVAGRDFVEEDDRTHPWVIIINESLARKAWPGEDPIGKTVKLFNDETPVQVVGVVRDIRDTGLRDAPAPFAFFPLRQLFAPGNVFHVRTAGNAADLMPTLRKELQAIDPAVNIAQTATYDDLIRQAMWGPRTGATLMSGFGVIALLLASLGIYAVMSQAVSQRTREIGIRIAIGAQARAVLTLVLRRGAVVTGLGLIGGLAASFALTRYIRGFLFEIKPTDPLTFAAIAVMLAVVALLACYIPARRATRIDPLIALKTE